MGSELHQQFFRTAPVSQPRVAESAESEARRRPRLRATVAPAIFALVVVVSLGIVAVSMWRSDRERQALIQLPPEVRARVYDGARAALAGMCPPGQRSPELAERCQREAQFLSIFPECDESCMRAVLENAPQPSR